LDSIIVEFKGKIHTSEDGIRYVSVPVFTSSHVVQGDRAHYTDRALPEYARGIGLSDGLRRIDSPRMTHVSGEFIGTFRVDLGSRRAIIAARKVKESIVSEWYAARDAGERSEGMLAMEERAHAAYLATLDEVR
jgi:hypothetical protein